jgi:hypothetical protein
MSFFSFFFLMGMGKGAHRPSMLACLGIEEGFGLKYNYVILIITYRKSWLLFFFYIDFWAKPYTIFF